MGNESIQRLASMNTMLSSATCVGLEVIVITSKIPQYLIGISEDIVGWYQYIFPDFRIV